MTYRVIILPRALRQLQSNSSWWAENRSPQQASRWLAGFHAAIVNLREHPDKHSLARESALGKFPFPIRQLLFGLGRTPTHRAVFEIRDDTVYVLAVRHLAQADITPDDI